MHTCLHFVFDWLTKSEDSIFWLRSLSFKDLLLFPSEPPRDWISRAECLVNHRLYQQLTCVQIQYGWRLNFSDRKTELQISSYITGPVSPCDGITHIYSPPSSRPVSSWSTQMSPRLSRPPPGRCRPPFPPSWSSLSGTQGRDRWRTRVNKAPELTGGGDKLLSLLPVCTVLQ